MPDAADPAVLVVRGPFEERTVAAVVADAKKRLEGTGLRRLVVDLTPMEFMDSSGIGGLVTIHSLAITNDAVMVLRGASAQTRGLPQRVGLAQVLAFET